MIKYYDIIYSQMPYESDCAEVRQTKEGKNECRGKS